MCMSVFVLYVCVVCVCTVCVCLYHTFVCLQCVFALYVCMCVYSVDGRSDFRVNEEREKKEAEGKDEEGMRCVRVGEGCVPHGRYTSLIRSRPSPVLFLSSSMVSQEWKLP